MPTSIMYRLFKKGGIPQELRDQLEAEGVLVIDEGIGGWLVERNVRSPMRWSLYKVRGFTGFLAITRKRVLAHAFGAPLIDIPAGDPRIQALHAAHPKSGRLTFTFDYATFHPGWLGSADLRFNTKKASAFYEALLALGVQADGARLSVRRGLR